MVLTSVAISRLAARRVGPPARVGAVTWRNLVAVRHSAYWLVVISGFFEPLLYLLSIGVGVGALVGGFTLPDGRTISYAAFVAPGMLAASAMNGTVAETGFNFYARLAWIRLYDAMVATPLRPIEIALGELGWALLRGGLYSMAFLAIMVGMGMTTPGWALAALVANLLVGLAFGAGGMAVSTLIRSWQDFDYVGVALMAMFLFTGTFAPASGYPVALRILVEALPLYQAVELVRALTTGTPGWVTLGNALYLAAFAAACLWLASRRMERKLLK
jgi:lipooligosaccharide transport system permease protein